MISRGWVAVIVCVLLVACSGMNVKNQVSKLDTALKQYGAALRWGRINQAYGFHVNREGQKPPFDLERMENFSVTNFRPIDPVINAEGTEATVPVEIDYYHEQYGTLRKIKYVQQWWYREESKQWFTEAEFPAFK